MRQPTAAAMQRHIVSTSGSSGILPNVLEQGFDERVGLEQGEVFGLFAHPHVLDRQADLLRIATTTPPLAVPSSLASTMPVHCTASVKCRAWLMPFWPVVASSTSSTSCGASGICLPITRWIFVNCCIRFCCVCSRPAVSTMHTSAPGSMRPGDRPVRHAGRVAAAGAGDDLRAQPAGPDRQLLDGGGPERVGGPQTPPVFPSA